jgi:5,10-methylenetetrahydromethanopterin reductase
MRVGVLLFSDYSVAELVELAVLSEGIGYETFWYTDVRFASECYVALAAVAARTSSMRIGPGVTDPYSRHPALTASAIATIDEVSNGRALLGLGTGGSGFRELGIQQKLPVAALRETVECVRGLLRGETVTLEGKVIVINGGKLSFEPVRSTIPVYFATHGPQVTRLAGQIADGVLIANTLRPKAFDFYVQQLDEGLAKGGRSPAGFDIGLRVEACISDDDEAAFTVMRRRVASRVMSQYPHWDYLTELGIELPAAFVELAAQRKPELVAEAAPLMPREVVESMVLAGNPERCARQLAAALHNRISSVTVRPHVVKGGRVGDVLKSFAQQVVPRALALKRESSTASA